MRADEVEAFILQEMINHVKQFEVLAQSQKRPENPRIHEINVKIEQIQQEIDKLLDKITSANDVLMGYINKKIVELDAQATTYRQKLAELSPLGNAPQTSVKQIKNCMEHWNDLSFDDKRAVVDQLIVKIKITEDTCDIEWKF